MQDLQQETLDLEQSASILGKGITVAHVRARIQRGTLLGYKIDNGEWRVDSLDLQRVLDDVEPCSNCKQDAVSYVIVKYHHHVRVNFTMCKRCADEAVSSYGRQGGVLELRAYPIHSEGWMKP